MTANTRDERAIAAELAAPVRRATELAERLGLQPDPVNFWIVDHDEMNQLIAYEGFQKRFPHWRWGMRYERQRATDRFLGGKAFELVNNDDPAHAFMQASNDTADQKAVITHVLAHSDFFANNHWFDLFDSDIDATAMLARHAERIESIISEPDVEHDRIEEWIDHVLCLQDLIDQHAAYVRNPAVETGSSGGEPVEPELALAELGVSAAVRNAVFGSDMSAVDGTAEPSVRFPPAPVADVLAFLREHGRQYDSDSDRAIEMEPWQREILDLLRREAYYFAPQRMTKVMNEGWASYWESVMMAETGLAGRDEIIDYADHQSKILGSTGLNPYKLGKKLWTYVENSANRREVVDRLLRVSGITWRTFHDDVDFDRVVGLLEPRPAVATIAGDTIGTLEAADPGLVDEDAVSAARRGDLDLDLHPWKVLTFEGLAERHYSLVKPQHRTVLAGTDSDFLRETARYIVDDAKYDTVEEAVESVDRSAGWESMFSVRATHNDVTFVDEFLTEEFVNRTGLFTYEYAHATDEYRVTSRQYTAVKRKLLLQFTNFGKPTVVIFDANFDNRNELLLGHLYTGIPLDIDQARQTLERVFELWARPVNLMTVIEEVTEKEVEIARRRNGEPEPSERGVRLRYDGDSHSTANLADDLLEKITKSNIDYDTTPADWYAT